MFGCVVWRVCHVAGHLAVLHQVCWAHVLWLGNFAQPISFANMWSLHDSQTLLLVMSDSAPALQLAIR